MGQQIDHLGHANSVPLVSVILPVHNGERFLAAALDSLLAQTWRDMEIVVIDDGSTDDTGSILRSYAVRERRVRVITQPKLGLVSALNRGLTAARGRFAARLDADDVALPKRLEKQIAYLYANPHMAAVGSQIIIIDADGRVLRRGYYPVGEDVCRRYLATRGAPVCHPAVTFRTDAVRAVGGYRDAYRHAEDLDLWLRLGGVGSIDNLPEILLHYRLHDGNASVRHSQRQAIATALAYVSARMREADDSEARASAVWPSDIDWPAMENLFPTPEAKALVRYVYFRTLILNGAIINRPVLTLFVNALPLLASDTSRGINRSDLAFLLTRAAAQLARHKHLNAAARILFESGCAAPSATLKELRQLLLRPIRHAA